MYIKNSNRRTNQIRKYLYVQTRQYPNTSEDEGILKSSDHLQQLFAHLLQSEFYKERYKKYMH